MRILATTISLAALGLAGIAHGQALVLPPSPPSILKQAVVDVGAVNIMPDVVFSRPAGGYRPLKLDLYRPKQQSGPLPAVIWLHGGGWQGGDQRGAAFGGTDMPTMLAELAGRGYVVASATYRLSGEAKFPAQGQDVRAAIRWVRANATEYGIDPSKVFLWGGSAGGYLASLAGVSCGEAGFDAPSAPARAGAPPSPRPAAGSECVQGVIAFYPMVDVTEAAKTAASGATDTPETRLYGCAVASCPASQVALGSVLGHIDAKDPPFLIMHGDADTTVSIDQSKLLDAALKAKGVPDEFIVVPGATHVFPTTNVSAARRNELMDRVYAFLDKNSGKKR
jgi:acetyl esterase/lipase